MKYLRNCARVYGITTRDPTRLQGVDPESSARSMVKYRPSTRKSRNLYIKRVSDQHASSILCELTPG